jgi:hypothetical protein
MRRVLAAAGGVLTFVRWWWGVTYVLTGVGAIMAGPIMMVAGNAGGFYVLIGGPFIFAFGWVVHPWGLQRTARREAEGYDRTSALLPSRWDTVR